MNLFVDDLRPFPTGESYMCARTYELAVEYLKLMNFEFCTLDYDLGEGETGLNVLEKMLELNKFPRRINIHSDHSVGKYKMKDYIELNFPQNTVLTMNAL